MNDTIHVELACAVDAAALTDFLSDRGLTASVANANDHCDIEIGFADGRLTYEFERALGSWLEHNDRQLVPIATAEHGYVLRPPGD